MEKTFIINGTEIKTSSFRTTPEGVSFVLNGKTYTYSLVNREGRDLIFEDSSRIKAHVGSPNRDGEMIVMALGREAVITSADKKVRKGAAHAGGLVAPMPGKIFKVVKEAGASVRKGETILILEAMKMEHSIRADKDGTVKKLNYKVGDLVTGGVVLAEVE